MKGFNSKTLVFGVVTTVLLIAIIMPSVPFASSVTVTICDKAKIDSGTFENVLVKDGLDCSLNRDVVVTGNIQVESGAAFSANGISIAGNVLSDGARGISITGSTIGGNLQIKNTNLAPVISVVNNIIVGNLEINDSTVDNGMIIVQNNVGGNLMFSENTASFIMMGGNIIGQNLDCTNNVRIDNDTPSIMIVRGLNTVTGAGVGQCATMVK